MPTRSASSSAAALVQATVPGYRLTAPHAQTVHGPVYHGVHRETDAPVLIKVIPRHLNLAFGGASWETLRAETARLSRIDHARIAALLEMADGPAGLVLVSRAVAGSSVYRLLANDLRPDRSTVIRWGIECLALLAEAHARDVLHRFLSEHAIAIDQHAHVVLRGITLTDCSARERLLLSPEQVLDGTIGPQSDIFSLGLLMGRLLQRGDQASSLPDEDPLRSVLLRAVAQDPASRYEDVFAMVAALRDVQAHEPPPRPSNRSTAVLAPVQAPAPASRRQPPAATQAEWVDPAGSAPSTGPQPTVEPAAIDARARLSEVAARSTPALDAAAPASRRGRPRWSALVAAAVAVAVAVAALVLGWVGLRGDGRPDAAVAKANATNGTDAPAMAPKPAVSAGSTDAELAGKTAGAAKAAMMNKTAEQGHGHDHATPRQDARSTADALIAGGLVGNLFRHADLPQDDTELLADLVADIEALSFADDPRGAEPIDSLFGVNPLLGDANPALSEEARAYWLSLGIEEYGTEAAVAHLEAQHHHADAGDLDRAGWYEHVLACERLCGMVVVGLLYEHIRQVESSPRSLLRFSVNQSDLDGQGHTALADLLAQRQAGDHILLVGRGSRTGDRAYNLALSKRRIQAVHDALREADVAADHIHRFALGYEPPQLTPSLLRRYDIAVPPGGIEAVNQSVLVVVYTPANASRPRSNAG